MYWHEFRRRALGDKLFLAGATVVIILSLVGVFANQVAPYDPYEMQTADRLQPPSMQHVLGTDWAGRDSLSRLIKGTQITLAIAFSIVVLAGIGGVALGLLAGYYGGVIDTALMAVTDVVFAFPQLVLALAIAVYFGPSTQNLIVVLSILYTPQIARITRGAVLGVKEELYVDAARVVGCRAWRIILRYILPNVTAPVLVQLTIGFSYAILSEASLTFLGFGAQPPDASWGTMLNEGRPTIWVAVWPSAFAGAFIAAAVMGFNFAGDGLRDILDPTLRHR